MTPKRGSPASSASPPHRRRRAADTFQVLADAMPVLISYVSKDLKYEFVSRVYSEFFGLPIEEIVDRPVADLIGAEAFAMVQPLMEHALQGEVVKFERRLPFPKGARVMQAIYVPHYAADGSVIGIVGLAEDVSARVQTETRLRRSEEMLSEAQRLGHIGSWEAELGPDRDLATAKVSWSAETYRIYGYDAAQVIPSIQLFLDAISSDDARGLSSALRETVMDGVPFDDVACIVRRDGATRWVHSRAEFRSGTGSALPRLVGSVQDITDLKATEDAYRESDARLKLAQSAAGLAIWEWDLASDRSEFTPEYYSLFGLTSTDEPTSSVDWRERFLHPDDRERVAAELQQAIDGGRPYDTEFRVIWPDGSVHWLAGRGRVIRDHQGEPVSMVGVNFDVTKRRETEERLRQAAKMEAIGRLAGGLAHDLNNQLHALVGFTDFIDRDPGLSADSRDDLEEIRRSAERMASLTQQILAFSRRREPAPVAVDVNAAIESSLAMLQRLLGTDVEVITNLAPESPAAVIDPGQLTQIVMNFLINARDAMPGGGRLKLSTAVIPVPEDLPTTRYRPAIPRGRYAEIAVADEGTGIPSEHLSRLFEPFFTTKEEGRGTGLGLATVQGIVAAAGGIVWAENLDEGGARFVVLLPLAPEAERAGAHDGASETAGHEPVKVLVVDDEDAVRGIVVRTLVADGFEVLEADCGARALEVLARQHQSIQVVVTDVVMPGMSGLQLGEMVRSHYPDLPIVFMSGFQRDASLDEQDRFANHTLLQKPVPQAKLVATVRAAARRR